MTPTAEPAPTIALEQAVATRVAARHVVACASLPAAFDLALRVLGLGAGKRVWASPLALAAAVEAAQRRGAEVTFLDVDPRTQNVSARALVDRLVAAERTGETPAALVAADFAGHPAELRALHDLANRYGFYLVEDASEALGARYEDAAVGGSRFSDLTILGVPAGPGSIGVITTSRSDWADELRRFRDLEAKLPEAEAAHALAALAALDDELARRETLVARYDEALVGFRLGTPWRSPDHRAVLAQYWVTLQDGDEAPWNAVLQALCTAGIAVVLPPVLLNEESSARCPEAARFASRALGLPLTPGADPAQVAAVLAAALR